MKAGDRSLRTHIVETLHNALQSLPYVLAGWEGGSAAFGLVDEYSDIDLNFLLDDASQADSFYKVAQSTLEQVSPVVASHPEPPGRYFKLADAGEFLLVDVCILEKEGFEEYLNSERHGTIIPLFDKGQWLEGESPAPVALTTRRAERLDELRNWFSINQNFVRKAILRGQETEALAAYWGYTLKPLVELLRMRYCPVRWDFGMRYLQQDLPAPVYRELRNLTYVREPDDLVEHLTKAVAWGEGLLQELE